MNLQYQDATPVLLHLFDHLRRGPVGYRPYLVGVRLGTLAIDYMTEIFDVLDTEMALVGV